MYPLTLEGLDGAMRELSPDNKSIVKVHTQRLPALTAFRGVGRKAKPAVGGNQLLQTTLFLI